MAQELTEGWGVFGFGTIYKKAHYFRNGESLCRKYGFYHGPLELDEYESTDDCAACRKKLEKEKKVA